MQHGEANGPQANRAYVSCITCTLGDLVPLRDLAEFEGSETNCAHLLDQGFAECSVFSGSSEELAECHLRVALEGLKEVDLVLLTGEATDFNATQVFARNGMADTPIFMIQGMQCAGLVAAIQVATGFVRSGLYKRIFCISIDRVAEGICRQTLNRMAVLGDGATSCLITSCSGELEVLGATFASRTSLYDPVARPERILTYSSMTSETAKALLSDMNIRANEVDLYVSINIEWPMRLLMEGLKVDGSRQFRGNTRRFAHVLSSDVLINLKSALEANPDARLVLLSGLSPQAVGFVLLRRVTEGSLAGPAVSH